MIGGEMEEGMSDQKDARPPCNLDPMNTETRRLLLIEGLRMLLRANGQLEDFWVVMNAAGYHANTALGESYARVWDLLKSRVLNVQDAVQDELKRLK